MNIRTTTIWIALATTGSLCLAVGAVRLPRMPVSVTTAPEASDSTAGTPHSTDAPIIPLRNVHLPADHAGLRGPVVASSDNRMTGSEQFASAFVDNSNAGQPAPRNRNDYHEPEPWPFHRSRAPEPSTSSGPGRSAHSARPDRTPVADWPYQRATDLSGARRPQRTLDGTSDRTSFPNGSGNQTPFHQLPRTSQTIPGAGAGYPQREQQPITRIQPHHGSNDLLNPGLAFGSQSIGRATAEQTSEVSHTRPGAQGGGPPIQPPPVSSMSRPGQSPLRNLPAPQPPPEARRNILEAGHAGSDGKVIHAHSESVTSRNHVTVEQWSGPHHRPVQSIQTVSFNACPDGEDVQRVPAESLIRPYAVRANGYPESAALPRQTGQLAELPRDYAPWWEEVINKPLRAAPATQPIDVESLIFKAIEHSPQVTAFRIDPIIRETQILEEAAEFDWQSFIETRYDDSNDPIGNVLTTGDNSDRFVDRHLTSRLGLEKRMAQGGTLDVTQNFGLQNNNSTFLIPQQQGTSRLELNFTQPLLRGAGQTYNESRTVLAMLDHQISEDELQESLQDHLLEVYTTYWNLYRARAVRLQKERLLRRAMEVEQKLTARQGIDSVRRQVLRARAAVASRQSEIARADMEVRNAESRLRLLVNSPDLKRNTVVELLPLEAPMSDYLMVSMRGSVETALQNRPDIRRAIKQIKETAVRLEVSRNELLPKLDLVLGTYVAGLEGKSQVDNAWIHQFRDGRPGYTVGLTLQYPLGNRAARARYARREWEVARTLKEFEASIESSMTDVELAVRELETSYQEMLSRFQSMIAADTEATYLLERWRLLPGNDQTTSFLLEDVLDAQERVAMEEQSFVEAQMAYVLSVVRLKRASGILLSCDCGDSPVSFMTPAPRGAAEPKPLPQPFEEKPARPVPPPGGTRLTPPLPVLPQPPAGSSPPLKSQQSARQPSFEDSSGPTIIPLPGPTDASAPGVPQL